MTDFAHTVSADILVVGAGPAGISAARAAAKTSRSVHLLDDNPAPGGQIWRAAAVSGGHSSAKGTSPQARALRELQESGVRFHPATRVFAEPKPNVLEALVDNVETRRFEYHKLILATGARELFLPFPQWTLPGVFGAGGLQALVRGGYEIAGKRIAIVGTGPLLIAVAAHLRQAGALVVLLAEQAPIARMPLFAAALFARPSKLLQAARYVVSLRGTAVRLGWWPSEAIAAPDGNLCGVRLTNGRSIVTVDCDLIAAGFHLVANTELPELLGCALVSGPVGKRVIVDALQRTSRADVFCAGEPTGIAGLDAALLQGEIAGLAATGRSAEHLLARAASERAFGGTMDKVFALRPELRSLAAAETIVCRCEDVSYAQIKFCTGWTDAKLRTRLGMGPCQGRICGPATEFLYGWEPTSIRPPIFPVPLRSLISISTKDHEEIL